MFDIRFGKSVKIHASGWDSGGRLGNLLGRAEPPCRDSARQALKRHPGARHVPLPHLPLIGQALVGVDDKGAHAGLGGGHPLDEGLGSILPFLAGRDPRILLTTPCTFDISRRRGAPPR